MSGANSCSILPAETSDLDSICQLLECCGLPTLGLDEHMSTCLVARSDDGILGSVALEVYGGSALLRSLAVDAESRGTGLGKTLTAAAMNMAAENGVSDVYLLTETAPEFFGRLGFCQIERCDVPADVQCSVEFTTACPVSAQAMHRVIA